MTEQHQQIGAFSIVIKGYASDLSGWTSRDFLPEGLSSCPPLVHSAGYPARLFDSTYKALMHDRLNSVLASTKVVARF